jgi:hypothetical protein
LGDGTRHGPWGGWYPDGHRAIAGMYEKGEINGFETEWYDPEDLEGWNRFKARLRNPRHSRSQWSMGERHGEWTEWDTNGRVIQSSTWHRGEFVRYEHRKGDSDEDTALGVPFAALKKPQGCFDRQYFPRMLIDMMGEPVDGYSGYEVLYGTNVTCQRAERPCRQFNRAQLSDVMGNEIQGYSEKAGFAVRTCATAEDDQARVASQEATWRARSAADTDPGVIAFLTDINGVWCGRATRFHDDKPLHREVRIAFIPGDPDHAARATDTWSRTPGGPVGGPGYVMSSLLIPLPRKASDVSFDANGQPIDIPTSVRFKPVSVHTNAGSFTLTRTEQGLMLAHTRGQYPMSQNCEGFWAPGGPDPAEQLVESQ